MPSDHPPRPVRSRSRATLTILTLVALVAGLWLMPSTSNADGLDWSCASNLAEGPEGDAPLIDDAVAPSLVGGSLFFRGTAPAGMELGDWIDGDYDVTALPDGSTQFTVNMGQMNLWNGRWFVNFLGDNDPEFTLKPQAMINTKDPNNLGDLGLSALFHENFGFELDALGTGNTAVQAPGIQLRIRPMPAFRDQLEALGADFVAEAGLQLDYDLEGGGTSRKLITISLDDKDPGAMLPDAAAIALSMRNNWAEGQKQQHWGVGQLVTYPDVEDPAVETQPGLGLGVDVVDVTGVGDEATVEPFMSVAERWNHVPRTLGLGLRSICAPWDAAFDSTGHIAWNTGPVHEAHNTEVDLLVRSGIDAGIEITSDEGPARIDELALNATVDGVPETLDWIMHPNDLTITRSDDVTPTVTLGGLQLATDDPATEDDRPLWVQGAVAGLPRHTMVLGEFGDDGLDRADMTLWHLSCPDDAAAGDALADEITHPELSARNLPSHTQDCSRHNFDHAPATEVLIQNWLTADVNDATQAKSMGSIPTDPQFVHYGSVDEREGVPADGLFRMAARIGGLQRLVYDPQLPENTDTHLGAYVKRQPEADLQAELGNLYELGDLEPAAFDLETTDIEAPIADIDPEQFAELPDFDEPVGPRPVDPRAGGDAAQREEKLPPAAQADSREKIAEDAARTGAASNDATVREPMSRATRDGMARAANTAGGLLGGDVQGLAQMGGTPEGKPHQAPPMTGPPEKPLQSTTTTTATTAPRSTFDFGGIDIKEPVGESPVGGTRPGLPAGEIEVITLPPIREADDNSTVSGLIDFFWIFPPIIIGGPEPLEGDSLRIDIDLDTRDANTPDDWTGSEIDVISGMTPLPAEVSFELDGTETVPADVTWRASEPVSLPGGRLMANIDADTLVLSHFDVGANGALALPASGRARIIDEPVVIPFCWPRFGCWKWATGQDRFAVQLLEAAEPSGRLPVPPVPDHPDNAHFGVEIGATLADDADRAANERLRIYGQLIVPQTVDVQFITRDGEIEHIDGSFCDGGIGDDCQTVDSGIATNSFDLTAVHSAPMPTEPWILKTAPAMPPAPAAVTNANPAFSDWHPSSGVRAIMNPDTWGVKAKLRGLAEFGYDADPVVVEAELHIPQICTPTWDGGQDCTPIEHTGQPFTANVLDSRDPAGPLFVDTHLTELPADMRFAMLPDFYGTEPGDAVPWFWLNTKDVNQTSPWSVNWNQNAATGGELTGTIRYGDRTALAAMGNASPLGERGADGIDAWFHSDAGTGTAVDSRLKLDIPRHLGIWKPLADECNAESSTFTLAECMDTKHYQMDEITAYDVEYKATRNSLGDLRVHGDLLGDGTDLDIDATVANLPGQLRGQVEYRENLRTGSIDVNADIDSNAALGTVLVEIHDNNDPVGYRDATGGNAFGTANYAVRMANVPDDIELDGEVYLSEPRLTPAAPTPDESDFGRLGYIHADIDLHNDAENLLVQAHQAHGGHMVANVQGSEPVSGKVNARMDNMVIDPNQQLPQASPFWEVMKSWFGYVPFLNFIVGGFAELLYGGDTDLDVVLDLDLPIYLDFDHAQIIRVGLNATTMSADSWPSSSPSPQIGFRQRSMTHEPFFSQDGAWYRDHDVSFTHDSWAEDFDISTDYQNAFDVVGIYDWKKCKKADDDDDCFWDNDHENIAPLSAFTAKDRNWAGWQNADMIYDIIFTHANRQEMDDEDWGVVEPGVGFYEGLADSAAPLVADDFAMPQTSNTTTRIGNATVNYNRSMFYGILIANCSESNPAPTARSTDGTTYTVGQGCQTVLANKAAESYGAVLKAEYSNGVPRWGVALPNPPGFDPDGNDDCFTVLANCRVDIQIEPEANGSALVMLETFSGNNAIGFTFAWFDASGHPGFWQEGAGEVSALAWHGISDDPFDRGQVSIDACDNLGVCGLPPGESYDSHQWIFGDGTMTSRIDGAPGAVDHKYPATTEAKEFLGMLLIFDDNGDVTDKKYFRATAGGPTWYMLAPIIDWTWIW